MPPIKRSLVIASLMRHEGFRSQPYRCTQGKLTVGYGRNLEGKGLSRPEGAYLLENDVTEGIAEALQAFPWLTKVDEARGAVIVECVIALGLPAYRGFKKHLAACVAGDWETAAVELLDSKLPEPDQWGPIRSNRLANQLRTGKVAA